uniref:Uncharacterized protein n=1 Tax=Setaria viridis TaxID=4556 RepID=A0A4U6UYV5_SETVI|nr:hypothetical protein SEVIR_4G024101v2 [Setaria viridis]
MYVHNTKCKAITKCGCELDFQQIRNKEIFELLQHSITSLTFCERTV